MAARISASSFSLSHGFCMKLAAPNCMARRHLHGAVGGNHDDGELRVEGANVLQQIKSTAAGQRQIEQHQVEGTISQSFESPSSPSAAVSDFIAFQLQQHLQRLANRGFIVNDEHASLSLTAYQRLGASRNYGDFRHDGLPQ